MVMMVVMMLTVNVFVVNIEKVLRLLGILELFFSNPVLKDKYIVNWNR